jgi:SET domain-containing protein
MADVCIRDSVISGKGVFASKRIEKGQVLGCYEGEQLTLDQFNERYPLDNSVYVLDIGDGLFIDARDPEKSNFARYINSPKGTTKKPNVVFLKKGIIAALKRIQKDEELLVSYGRKYFWK